MFGSEALSAPAAADSVAHIIQVALTPVFLLSGIASLLGVFAGRLARVADRVDALTEKLDDAAPAARSRLERRLAHLRRRSHALDIAVVLGAVGGAATCAAAVILFIASLRDVTTRGLLFSAFGAALFCTMGALAAFLAEMLMASRGLRGRVPDRGAEVETPDAPDAPEMEPHAHEAGASVE